MTIQKFEYCIDGHVFRCSKYKSLSSIKEGSFLYKSKILLFDFAATLFLHHLIVLKKDIDDLINMTPSTVVEYSNMIRKNAVKYDWGGLESRWRGSWDAGGILMHVDESCMSGAKLTRNNKVEPVKEKL